MASQIETLARHLVRTLYTVTAGRPLQWRSLAGISDKNDTEAAVKYAVDKGWMLYQGGHSVCLTEAGRREATK